MKIQIDTTEKIIKIETIENLGELVSTLEKMLPDGKWKEFKLETNTIINWSSPIIWKEYVPYHPYPTYPWIYYDAGQTLPIGTPSNYQLGDQINKPPQYGLSNGIFNIEV